MKFGKLSNFVMALFFLAGTAFVYANEGQVKQLLKDGLELYNQKQYVRALDIFKQAQTLDPNNALAAEYIKSTKQRILEWEHQSGDADPSKGASWDSLLNPRGGLTDRDTALNARDIVAARKSLVERMKNRSSNMDNIVQISETSKNVDILLFHDQLFFPGLTALRDEAFPVLMSVAQALRRNADRAVTVRSVTHENSTDPTLLFPEFSVPAADPRRGGSQISPQEIFQDLESTRAYILFTYLAQKATEKVVGAHLE
jgi:tetratricopeptide (TPR) repeat protein